MKRKIRIIVANPAGNITIFVKDRMGRDVYQKVASQLLDMEELKGEQVAFMHDAPECGRAEGKMEMCGLEFCGNASRSYGLIRAKEMGIEGEGKVFVDASGCSEILTVGVNTETGFTKIKMPLPVSMSEFDLSKLPIDDLKVNPMAEMLLRRATCVNFGGIVHVVLSDIEPKKETFELIKDRIIEVFNPPAMGVMFCDSSENKMTPVVYVRDVDTTYFEGSCGSGTTACAAAFGAVLGDGEHKFSFPQPAGTIDAEVVINRKKIEEIYIEGPVELSEEMEVEVEI
ncbi:MAG: hypothetical protein IJN72_04140 [Firmicutes bacterium]|nr:hypothetical protein [Bacillota bacterium]